MIGYSFQYSWASLVVQMAKNLPAMREPPGWEDPLEGDMATHSSILAWEIPMDRGALWAIVRGGCKEQDLTPHSTAQHMQQSLFFLILIWPLQLSFCKHNDFSFGMCHIISRSLTKRWVSLQRAYTWILFSIQPDSLSLTWCV